MGKPVTGIQRRKLLCRSIRRRTRIDWRSQLDRTLVYCGSAAVLLQAAWIAGDPFERPLATRRLQMGVVVLGLLANQFGIWRGSSRFSFKRMYLALRGEVEGFLTLVRRLNTSVVEGDDAAVEKVRAEMNEAVDAIVAAAGAERRTRHPELCTGDSRAVPPR